MFPHILVPVDGSDVTNAAVDVAIRLAREQKAILRFVTVVDGAHPHHGVEDALSVPDPHSAAEAHKEVVRDAANTANRYGCDADFAVIEGSAHNPGESIAQAAGNWPADLIVMGSHARHGLNRMTRGSVTEATLRHASVPVLMIPPTCEEKSG
jgi:nucleotide-binding universal stress UspA family protein